MVDQTREPVAQLNDALRRFSNFFRAEEVDEGTRAEGHEGHTDAQEEEEDDSGKGYAGTGFFDAPEKKLLIK